LHRDTASPDPERAPFLDLLGKVRCVVCVCACKGANVQYVCARECANVLYVCVHVKVLMCSTCVHVKVLMCSMCVCARKGANV